MLNRLSKPTIQQLDYHELDKIYQAILTLQNDIENCKTILSAAKSIHDKTEINSLLHAKESELATLLNSFHHLLISNPNYKQIKINSKQYEYFYKTYLRGPSYSYNVFRRLLDLYKNPLRDLKIYANHYHYLNDTIIKQILLQDFSTLTHNEKNIFVEQLMRQPDYLLDNFFASQSMNDLIELRAECSARHIPKLGYKIKYQQVKLLSEIKYLDVNAMRYTTELAALYLKEHNKLLAELTGTYKNNLDSIFITRSTQKVYLLYVQTEHHKYPSCPILLNYREVIQYASLHIAKQNKILLNELLFPAAIIQPKNDAVFIEHKSIASNDKLK